MTLPIKLSTEIFRSLLFVQPIAFIILLLGKTFVTLGTTGFCWHVLTTHEECAFHSSHTYIPYSAHALRRLARQ
jgi:hypothetical protein